MCEHFMDCSKLPCMSEPEQSTVHTALAMKCGVPLNKQHQDMTATPHSTLPTAPRKRILACQASRLHSALTARALTTFQAFTSMKHQVTGDNKSPVPCPAALMQPAPASGIDKVLLLPCCHVLADCADTEDMCLFHIITNLLVQSRRVLPQLLISVICCLQQMTDQDLIWVS